MKQGAPLKRTPLPELVGVAEAAALLGVYKSAISRYLRNGTLPPPALRLRATPVWYRDDIERLKAKRSKRGGAT